MTEHYIVSSNSPQASGARKATASREFDYWAEQHRANPGLETSIATGVSVNTRMRIQEHIGDMHSMTDSFSNSMRTMGDDFSGLSLDSRGSGDRYPASGKAPSSSSAKHNSVSQKKPNDGYAKSANLGSKGADTVPTSTTSASTSSSWREFNKQSKAASHGNKR